MVYNLLMLTQYRTVIEEFLARYSIPSPWGLELYDAVSIVAGGLSLLFLLLFLSANRGDKPLKAKDVRKKDQKTRPPRALVRKAKKAEKKGDLAAAGELFMAAGHYEEAARSFVKIEAFGKAAEACLAYDDFSNAARCQVKIGNYQKAGELFVKSKEFTAAAENLLMVGNIHEAANMFVRGGDSVRAADCYAKVGFSEKAGELLAAAGDFDKAAPLLMRALQERISRRSTSLAPDADAAAGNLADLAAEALSRSGHPEQAATALEMGGRYARSAAIYEELGNRGKASDLYIRAKDTLSAARVLESSDHPEAGEGGIKVAEALLTEGKKIEAAELLNRLGEHHRAAELFLAGGLKERAAEAYRMGGEINKAAEIMVDTGKSAEAAQLLMEAGQATEAAGIFRKMGETEKEVDALLAAGAHFQAGKSLLDLGRHKDAIGELQKVEEKDENHGEANRLLGDIFFDQEQWSVAISRYQKALADSNINRENLESYYRFAMCLKNDNQHQASANILEKILLVDYHYRDVKDQVKDLKEAMPASSSGQALGNGSLDTTMVSGAREPGKSGRYKIMEELGRGGMGVVYKVRDTVLDREVAYKVLPPQVQRNQKILDMFLREAKSAAKLTHPNIVTIYDADSDRGEYFIIMELVKGESLKQILEQQGRFPVKTALVLIGQVLKGLSYAHSQGIVHRDIKPANLLWAQEKKLVKITDFGLARVIEEGRRTHTQMAGTPYYMAPEQIVGGRVDHRADIYAMGVTLYEFVTGTVPFKEGDVLYHHVHTPPPPPQDHDPSLPEPLSAFILRCLEKDSESRFDNIDIAMEELKKLLM